MTEGPFTTITVEEYNRLKAENAELRRQGAAKSEGLKVDGVVIKQESAEVSRLMEENAALRSHIQNESEPCKCNACTDQVPRQNEQIKKLNAVAVAAEEVERTREGCHWGDLQIALKALREGKNEPPN